MGQQGFSILSQSICLLDRCLQGMDMDLQLSQLICSLFDLLKKVIGTSLCPARPEDNLHYVSIMLVIQIIEKFKVLLDKGFFIKETHGSCKILQIRRQCLEKILIIQGKCVYVAPPPRRVCKADTCLLCALYCLFSIFNLVGPLSPVVEMHGRTSASEMTYSAEHCIEFSIDTRENGPVNEQVLEKVICHPVLDACQTRSVAVPVNETRYEKLLPVPLYHCFRMFFLQCSVAADFNNLASGYKHCPISNNPVSAISGRSDKIFSSDQ
ncbi:hypothetical protein ES703_95530 [subsurface metagenome]